jgi:hypothetical protein
LDAGASATATDGLKNPPIKSALRTAQLSVVDLFISRGTAKNDSKMKSEVKKAKALISGRSAAEAAATQKTLFLRHDDCLQRT